MEFLPLIAVVVVFVILKEIFKGKRSGPTSISYDNNKLDGFDPTNYQLRQTLMTSNERIFFEKLRRAIGDKYDIYPQVNLDKIFKIKFQSSRFKYNIEKSRIDKKSIDFLITIRHSQAPYIGIELDDNTHFREDRVNRDEKVNALFDMNGITLIRVSGPNHISEEELRKIFNNE